MIIHLNLANKNKRKGNFNREWKFSASDFKELNWWE